MRASMVVMSLVLGLTACATEFQQQSFTGGYSETQLSENAFRVAFNGNGYTSRERAADFALLRSAELAISHGFNYFVIVEAANVSDLSTFTTPTNSHTTASVTAYGNSAYGSASTTTYGGQTFIISKPSSTNTIVCFREKPQIAGIVYDASYVDESIRRKYNLGSTLSQVPHQNMDAARTQQQAEHLKHTAASGDVFLAGNANHSGVTTTASGLQYKVITRGTGATPTANDTVTVQYRGSLIDGTEFDSSYSRGQPSKFPLNGVIAGWQEGVQLMQEGGKSQLVIPPSLAYGDKGVLAGQVLVFEVELIKVDPPAATK